MSAFITTEDHFIHQSIFAESPNADLDDDGINPPAWRVDDTLPINSDICSAIIKTCLGVTGDFKATLIRHASSASDSSVRLFWSAMDGSGSEITRGMGNPVAVTSTEAEASLSIGPVPAGTSYCELGLMSDMAAGSAPVRTNQFLDPRCAYTNLWTARSGWTLTANNTASGLPGGITSNLRVACVTAGAFAHTGLNMFDTPAAGTPTNGLPIEAGVTYTVSGYMYSTKAGTFSVSYRFFSGTTWYAGAVDSPVTTAAANTWTRVSYTFTAPIDGYMAGAWRMPGSITWAVGDYIALSCVLIEKSATLEIYFDGTSLNAALAAPSSVRWEGQVNGSRSFLYASATPGGPVIQMTDASFVCNIPSEELIGVALERNLRRSATDVWGRSQALITSGAPGMLQGQLTYLCGTLSQAMMMESAYLSENIVVLGGDHELAGLNHRAVGSIRMNPAQQLPGKAPMWLVVVDFRQQYA